MNEDLLYEKVLERIIQEFNGVAAIAGVTTPVGTGPDAGKQGENIYKDSKSSDDVYRKNSKSKQKSVQWYLKNN